MHHQEAPVCLDSSAVSRLRERPRSGGGPEGDGLCGAPLALQSKSLDKVGSFDETMMDRAMEWVQNAADEHAPLASGACSFCHHRTEVVPEVIPQMEPNIARHCTDHRALAFLRALPRLEAAQRRSPRRLVGGVSRAAALLRAVLEEVRAEAREYVAAWQLRQTQVAQGTMRTWRQQHKNRNAVEMQCALPHAALITPPSPVAMRARHHACDLQRIMNKVQRIESR